MSVGHGGMALIGVIGNSLLYSVGDRWVSVGHGGMVPKGVIGKSLLYSVCYR